MNRLRWPLAFLASAAGLWFAFRGTDWAAMRSALADVRSPGWLLLFLVYPPFEYFLRTHRWILLLRPLKELKAGPFFPITVASFFLNNVLPFRAGEIARVYWTGERAALPFTSVLAVLVADRVFDMMCLLTLVAVVLTNNSGLFQSPRMVLTFAAVTFGGLLALMLLALFPEKVKQLTDRPWAPRKLKAWIDNFIDGARALRRPATLLKAYALSMVFWLCNVALVRQAATVFSLDLSFLDAAWVVIAFCFGALLPSTPGYVGTLEAAGVAALQLLGHDKNHALPFVVVIHFAQILATALWGIPCLLTAGLKVKRS